MHSRCPGTKMRRQRQLLRRSMKAGGRRLASVRLPAAQTERFPPESLVMTTLDDLLYAWLAEADESRFVRAFNAYYGVAFPAVIRHLTRTAPSDPALLEEIAQDALLRFFERIGRGRRLASETVEQALIAIHPLAFGPFHERQVGAWKSDVSDYRVTVMGFRPTRVENGVTDALQNAVRELALRIPPLQSRGWQLIDHVRVELRWGVSRGSTEPLPTAMDAEAVGIAEEVDAGMNGGSFAALSPATVELAKAVLQAAASAVAMDDRVPGTNQFVRGTASVVEALPRLRVPSNGYLFETAMSLYLDDYRRRGRQKRGGARVSPAHDTVLRDAEGGLIGHPLEQSMPDQQRNEDYVTTTEDSVGARLINDMYCADRDPIGDLEDVEFFERFHEYLREPLAAAEEAYDAARTSGRAIAERRKRDSLAQKFSRIIEVLSTIGEGYTQEETAQRLGLSRNQVKYVIEILQEAYQRFTEHSARAPSHRQSRGASSHAE